MKEKRIRKPIRSIVIAIILTVMIPVNLLGIMTYVSVYVYVKETLVATQQGVLDHYAEQMEGWLDNTESYLLRVLSDRQLVDLLWGRGNQKYELTKVRLLRELESNVRISGQGSISTYWCYVKNTGENIFVYNDVSYEDSIVLREWGRSAPVEDWTVQTIDGTEYLHLGYENSILYMGALVRIPELAKSWNRTSEFPMSVESEPGREGYELTTGLGETGVTLHIWVPREYISRGVPFRVVLLFANVLAGILVMILSVSLFQWRLAKPLVRMSETIQRIQSGEKELRITACDGTKETAAIESSFNSLMDQIYHLEISNYEMELENQRAQLVNLQLQINPHLLLNTFNTIYGLAEIGEIENIQTFTMNLVRYFRYSLKNSNELVTLAQELDFIRSYVEIQKIRYPDRFYVVYDVEDFLLEERIPPLILQNFVENSIKYSLGQSQTEILVIVHQTENRLQISICDDGVGMEDEVLMELRKGVPYIRDGETHVGICNCLRRLRLFYGEEIDFSITSCLGEGTQVWMELPCVREEEDEAVAGGR